MLVEAPKFEKRTGGGTLLQQPDTCSGVYTRRAMQQKPRME